MIGSPSSIPPLRIAGWWHATRDLSLEQKGLLMEALDLIWIEPQEVLDLGALRRRVRLQERALKRLWTPAVSKAFSTLRRQRRPIDTATRREVADKTPGTCIYCGEPVAVEPRQANTMRVDHVKAVVRGGSSHIDNLVPACRSCNARKGAKPLAEFLASEADHG